jgi:hypothetical protein
VNGVAAGSTAGVNIQTSTDNVSIGRQGGAITPCNYFDGSIDEVAVFDRALPLSEIEALYADAAFDGNHTISVTAFDTSNQTGQDSVAFTIGSVNQAPTVSLSVSGGPFTAPADVTLTATASDPDGTIDRVEFYRDGTTVLNSDSTAPYSFVWSGVAAGSYSIVSFRQACMTPTGPPC